MMLSEAWSCVPPGVKSLAIILMHQFMCWPEKRAVDTNQFHRTSYKFYSLELGVSRAEWTCVSACSSF